MVIPAILLALLASATAWPEAGTCPALPKDFAFEWTVQQGPDFDVCYAHPPGDTNALFGLYLGHASAFAPRPGADDEVDTIGGHAVTWQAQTGKDGDLPFGQETLLEVHERDGASALEVHVWINARTRDERDSARRILRDLSFEASAGGK